MSDQSPAHPDPHSQLWTRLRPLASLPNRGASWFYQVVAIDGQGITQGPARLLRVIPENIAQRLGSIDSLSREIERTALLQFPGSIAALEIGRYSDPIKDQQLVYVLEDGYDPDNSLLQHILRQRQGLAVNDALQLCLGLSRCLSLMHENGMQHGALGPGQVILDRPEQGRLVSPIVARMLALLRKQGGGVDDSLPDPDQAALPKLKLSDDILGLGGILHLALTGKLHQEDAPDISSLPLGMRDPRLLRPDLRNHPTAVLVCALHHDPIQRYQLMSEFAQDLQDLSAGKSPQIALDRWGEAVRTHAPEPAPNKTRQTESLQRGKSSISKAEDASPNTDKGKKRGANRGLLFSLVGGGVGLGALLLGLALLLLSSDRDPPRQDLREDAPQEAATAQPAVPMAVKPPETGQDDPPASEPRTTEAASQEPPETLAQGRTDSREDLTTIEPTEAEQLVSEPEQASEPEQPNR